MSLLGVLLLLLLLLRHIRQWAHCELGFSDAHCGRERSDTGTKHTTEWQSFHTHNQLRRVYYVTPHGIRCNAIACATGAAEAEGRVAAGSINSSINKRAAYAQECPHKCDKESSQCINGMAWYALL